MFKKGTLVRLKTGSNSPCIVMQSDDLITVVFHENNIHYIFNENLEVVDV